MNKPEKLDSQQEALLELSEKAGLPLYVVGHPWNPDCDYAVSGNPDPHIGIKVLYAAEQDCDEDPENEFYLTVLHYAVEAANNLPRIIRENESLQAQLTQANKRNSELREAVWKEIFHELIPLMQVKITSYPEAESRADEGMDHGMYCMLNFVQLFAEKAIPDDDMERLKGKITALQALANIDTKGE